MVSGAPTLTTTATTSSGPGSYPITMAQGTLSAANYSFAPQSGTLTVSLLNSVYVLNGTASGAKGVRPAKIGTGAKNGAMINGTAMRGR